MCTVLLPPGVNPFAVNKYISYHITYHIISYHIISYHIISYLIIYHITSYITSHHIKDPFYVTVCRQELKVSVGQICKQISSNATLTWLPAFLTVYCTMVLVFISPNQTTQPHSASEDYLLFITPTPRLTTKPIPRGKCSKFILLPHTPVLQTVFLIQAQTFLLLSV